MSNNLRIKQGELVRNEEYSNDIRGISYTIRGNAYASTDLASFVVTHSKLKLKKIFVKVDTAPDGDDLIFDINKDGLSIIKSTKLTIDDGNTYGYIEQSNIDGLWYEGNIISIDCDQIGSSTAGGNHMYVGFIFE